MNLSDTELLVLTQWAQARVEALDRVIELRNRILAAWTPYRGQCKTLGEFCDTHTKLAELFETCDQAEQALELLNRAHPLGKER
jgi:hypothetical protein